MNGIMRFGCAAVLVLGTVLDTTDILAFDQLFEARAEYGVGGRAELCLLD